MSWYRAELPRDTEQLELLLGPSPSADELQDFFKTDDHINSGPSHLNTTNHHPLIKKPFRFTTPIPISNAHYLRFKPAGTYTSGIYISENYVTAMKERLNSIIQLSGDLNISLFTFRLDFVDGAVMKIFDIDIQSSSNQNILYSNSDYDLCNNLFETLAMDSNKHPKFNIVKYTSLRNNPKKNKLVYDIQLLSPIAKDITTYRVIKKGNLVEVFDVAGVSKFQYSI
jgi:hypothetical protein